MCNLFSYMDITTRWLSAASSCQPSAPHPSQPAGRPKRFTKNTMQSKTDSLSLSSQASFIWESNWDSQQRISGLRNGVSSATVQPTDHAMVCTFRNSPPGSPILADRTLFWKMGRIWARQQVRHVTWRLRRDDIHDLKGRVSSVAGVPIRLCTTSHYLW